MYAWPMDARSISDGHGPADSGTGRPDESAEAATSPPATSQSVMIAFDGGANSERAISYAGHFLKASVAHVVTAWQPGTLNPARLSSLSAGIQPFVDTTPLEMDVDDAVRDEAARVNALGVEMARRAGLEAHGTLVEVESTVWGALVSAADTLDVDLLVTGTRGDLGLKALLRSSVAGRVLKHCHRPVFVVPATCDKQPPVMP